jgi:hypothetical protein
METANISGSIRIDLKPDYARQINWGKPARSYFSLKRPQQKVEDFPLINQIKSTPGVSGVWYTDDKNSELIAIIKVQNPEEGKMIASTIKGYEGVKDVQISLGVAGPPPPPPSP